MTQTYGKHVAASLLKDSHSAISVLCKFLSTADLTFLLLVELFVVKCLRKMEVFLKSFGCSSNAADGEVLAGCLASAGHHLAASAELADLIIVNTCAVKGPTENRMIESLKRVSPGKKLIVAGCLPLINLERLLREVRFDGVIGAAAGDGIVDVANRVLSGEKVFALRGSETAIPSLRLPRIRSSRVISIIPVSYGCLGSCAYCCVIFARGRLRSYSSEKIVNRAKNDLAHGTREIWITSQDAACYGKDKGTDLARLLSKLCEIDGEFKIRVGMMTPNAAMSILDDLIEAFSDERVFKFLHLPVQSGDDDVLRRMRRFYSVRDFGKIVREFRKSFPEMTLSTDVICGFPGESQKAFANTLRLIEEVKPDVVNVSKFFARPRTAAAEMQKNFLTDAEIAERSRAAADLAKKVSLESNRRLIGWTGEVLFDEVGKIAGSWIGRNLSYKPIAVKSEKKLLGKSLRVKVNEAFPTFLTGEITD
jgi:threonylcarbamoyladenosine tRNA methylthiotransferase CDKAL1